jgi:hypothetical protein
VLANLRVIDRALPGVGMVTCQSVFRRTIAVDSVAPLEMPKDKGRRLKRAVVQVQVRAYAGKILRVAQ